MHSLSAGTVTYELRGQVALVGLNRENRRNAINDQVIEDLAKAIERARRDARAGVLFGHGTHFSAGLDLLDLTQKTSLEMVRSSQRWTEVFGLLEFGPMPWFCAMHGAVVGGGLELAASTHVRIADETAYFGLPEGQRGIFVGGGGSVRVARLLGVARMADLMLTGRTVDARNGEAWNLLHYVVAAGEAKARALELAERAAENAPLSNYFIVNALPRIPEMSREDGFFAESIIATFAADSPEAQERLSNFLNKKAGKVRAPPVDG